MPQLKSVGKLSGKYFVDNFKMYANAFTNINRKQLIY